MGQPRLDHLTRVEDWPLVSTEWFGSFDLKPFMFFDRNPGLEIADARIALPLSQADHVIDYKRNPEGRRGACVGLLSIERQRGQTLHEFG